MPYKCGFLNAVTEELGQKCCEIIFAKFLEDDALKEFRRTLDDGDVNGLKKLIDGGKLNVNQKVTFKDGPDVYSGTPVTMAIMYYAFMNKDTTRCRNTAYLKLLLDAGEKSGNTVDSIEDGGWTAALRACEYTNDDALQLIIERGANLEAKLYATGMTPLLMCVLHERYGCTRLLLEGGANVNATDMYGSTPLIVGRRALRRVLGPCILEYDVK
ncbi:unnamed protein product [Sphagnum balticum]